MNSQLSWQIQIKVRIYWKSNRIVNDTAELIYQFMPDERRWRWSTPFLISYLPSHLACSFPCIGSATSETTPLSWCNMLIIWKIVWQEQGFFPPGCWVGSAESSDQALMSSRAGISMEAWQQQLPGAGWGRGVRKKLAPLGGSKLLYTLICMTKPYSSAWVTVSQGLYENDR